MKQLLSNIKTRLHPVGLIIGLAGAGWIISAGFPYYGTINSWDKILFILNTISLMMPLFGGLIIAQKNPRVGGILLAFFGLLGPVNGYIGYLAHPFSADLYFLLKPFLQSALAYVIPGIIFLFAKAKPHATKYNDIPLSKHSLRGLFVISAAAVTGFILQSFRLHDFEYHATSIILGALLSSSGLAIIAIAAWKKPFMGGMLGAVYSLLMGAYFLILQATHRTVMLSQMKHEIAPVAILFVGSIIVLMSLVPRLKAVPASPSS